MPSETVLILIFYIGRDRKTSQMCFFVYQFPFHGGQVTGHIRLVLALNKPNKSPLS